MLVKCDKCGQGYEVNESRLSPQGARIKCPSCTHIFLVRLNNNNVASTAPTKDVPETSATSSKPQKEEASWRVRHIGLTYQFHDLTSLHDWLSARGALDDVKIAKNNDDWCELGDYPEVLTTELITKFFPLGDVPTSKKGAGNINSAISNTEARPGLNPDLGPLRSSPGISPISASPMAVSSNLSTAVESDARKNSRQARQEKKKAEAEKKKLKKKYIISGCIFIFLLIIFIVILRFNLNGGLPILQPEPASSEVVMNNEELKENIDQMRKTDPLLDTVQEAKAEDPGKQEEPIVTDEELAAMANADMVKRYEEAEQMVKNKKWPEALATLLSLVNDNPTHLEALQLLAKTYRALNQPEKAAEIDAQIKQVKSMADDIVIGE